MLQSMFPENDRVPLSGISTDKNWSATEALNSLQ